jgi:hypothetical protein
MFLRRLSLAAAALALAVSVTSAAAPAAIDMSTGLRYVVANAPIGECGTKAKTALSTELVNPFEAPPEGSGQWLAYGPLDSTGHSTAAAAIHCYPVGKGYVVTFTCAVELPGNPYAADDLCLRLGAVFQGKAATPLPSPTPVAVPTGCSTVNLVGVWTWNDKPNMTLTMDAQGGLIDSDGVSGNWNLSGHTVTLTYYGTQTITLSADGKHLNAPRGVARNFTRHC